MTEDGDEDVVQKLERSIDFWVEDRDDYPPAIRGVVAHLDDLRDDVRESVTKVGEDPKNASVELQRVLWFDDKNEKLDEACPVSGVVFAPYVSNEFGLISWKDEDNPLLDSPSKHRLMVSDVFAESNYSKPKANELILDDSLTGVSGPPERKIPEWSWKRKITQTLKPWRVKEGEVIKANRKPDDLMRTLNALCSVTKHGWLVIDLMKIKEKRGSILTYARTYEYQKKGDQKFQFLLQLIGVAAEYGRRLERQLSNVASIYLEADGSGEVFVTKVSKFEDKPGEDVAVIPVPARVVNEDGKPSQIVLDQGGKYFQAKIKPLVSSGKLMAQKLDIRKASTPDKEYRFRLKLSMDGPLLVASSGNALIFKLDEMLKRFRRSSLAELKSAKSDSD